MISSTYPTFYLKAPEALWSVVGENSTLHVFYVVQSLCCVIFVMYFMALHISSGSLFKFKLHFLSIIILIDNVNEKCEHTTFQEGTNPSTILTLFIQKICNTF